MASEGYDITQASSVLEVLKTKGEKCGLVGLIYDPLTKTYKQLPRTMTEKEIQEQCTMFNNVDTCPF